MITSDIKEILFSVLYALIFGSGFAVFYSFIILLKTVVVSLPKAVVDCIKFEKITPLPSFDYIFYRQSGGAFIIVCSVLIYGLGFSLLSYITLDGQIRIYMLILSFASFYLSKFAFYEICIKLLLHLYRLILILVSFFFRLILLPFKKIASHHLKLKTNK